jgi:hypothetical protein
MVEDYYKKEASKRVEGKARDAIEVTQSAVVVSFVMAEAKSSGN